MATDDRPRPLVTAAAWQAPLIGAGTLVSGPGYLGALTAIGAPIGRYDVVFAVALSLLSMAVPMLVARNIVRRVEPRVTPGSSPRDDRGRVLRPRDGDLLDQALAELAERRAQDGESGPAVEPPPAPLRPPAGPSRTTAFPAVGSARSMVRPGAGVPRSARPGGAPSADPPPYIGRPEQGDLRGAWPGVGGAEQDERIVSEHGPRADRIRRATGPRESRERPRHGRAGEG